MNEVAIIFSITAFAALGILAGFGAYWAKEAIAEAIMHKRIRRSLMRSFEENRPFASEELIREADKLMHDDNESDSAREFAKRVYIIGRTAQEDDEK